MRLAMPKYFVMVEETVLYERHELVEANSKAEAEEKLKELWAQKDVEESLLWSATDVSRMSDVLPEELARATGYWE